MFIDQRRHHLPHTPEIHRCLIEHYVTLHRPKSQTESETGSRVRSIRTRCSGNRSSNVASVSIVVYTKHAHELRHNLNRLIIYLHGRRVPHTKIIYTAQGNAIGQLHDSKLIRSWPTKVNPYTVLLYACRHLAMRTLQIECCNIVM